jgi:hypothetical protein
MTRPTRFLMRMAIFLVIVLAVAAVLGGPILRAFGANPALNGLILLATLFGAAYTFRQVWLLTPEVEWIEAFRRPDRGLVVAEPELLAPMATMLRDRQGRMTLSSIAMRSLLDGIGARLDERREIDRYLTGLLIFLGLLGTFWGLLETVSAIGNTIGSLSVPGGGDIAPFFAALQGGLRSPLGGMGIAFSSSLFGLAGSLVLGFLELQASQAQNRFYNELEEWLSGHARLPGAGVGGLVEGNESVPAYVQALLEQTADSLDNLQRLMARGEEARGQAQGHLVTLSERLATLTDQMRAEQNLLMRLAEGQMEIRPVLQRLAQAVEQAEGGLDEASRNHLRNLDVHVARLVEESALGRREMVDELRGELKLLARTLAALGEERYRDLRPRA